MNFRLSRISALPPIKLVQAVVAAMDEIAIERQILQWRPYVERRVCTLLLCPTANQDGGIFSDELRGLPNIQ